MAQHFPPIRYVVEGVIPEGLSLIVAPPKFGKSWLMLSLGLACSSGTNAFGVIPTGKSRPVLYAALEDGQRRLKARIQLLAPDSIDTTLHFITKLSREDVIPTLQAFVDKWHNHQPLIILDTLGKVMPPAIGGESSYERDYRVGGALKAIADSAPGAAVLVVHHTRTPSSCSRAIACRNRPSYGSRRVMRLRASTRSSRTTAIGASSETRSQKPQKR
jgi:RecA-family ATPase